MTRSAASARPRTGWARPARCRTRPATSASRPRRNRRASATFASRQRPNPRRFRRVPATFASRESRRPAAMRLPCRRTVQRAADRPRGVRSGAHEVEAPEATAVLSDLRQVGRPGHHAAAEVLLAALPGQGPAVEEVRRTRLRPVSKRLSERWPAYRVAVGEAMAESNGFCVAKVPVVCRVFASDPHHFQSGAGRRLLPGGGQRLLPVCRPCHDWIHGHPAEARHRGLLE